MNLILIPFDDDDISYDCRYYLANDYRIQHLAATNTTDLVLVMDSTWICLLLRGGGGEAMVMPSSSYTVGCLWTCSGKEIESWRQELSFFI